MMRLVQELFQSKDQRRPRVTALRALELGHKRVKPFVGCRQVAVAATALQDELRLDGQVESDSLKPFWNDALAGCTRRRFHGQAWSPYQAHENTITLYGTSASST